jgi:multiple sugar transport system permease protein
VLAIAVLGFFSVFFALPLAWLLLAPTKSTPQLNGVNGEHPFSFGSFDQLAQNWNSVVGYEDGIIWTWLGNSILYTGGALVLTILVTIPAGYALAMTTFIGRRVLLIGTLLVMLIPSVALALPIFLELSIVHLVNTPLAVILPFSFFPFGVYLAYIYFSTTISRDLLDAARIDGAGPLRMLLGIMLPIVRNGIVVVIIVNFVAAWGEYLFCLTLIDDEAKRTMPVVLAAAQGGQGQWAWPNVAAVYVIVVAPGIIAFTFAQRLFFKGLAEGVLKG